MSKRRLTIETGNHPDASRKRIAAVAYQLQRHRPWLFLKEPTP